MTTDKNTAYNIKLVLNKVETELAQIGYQQLKHKRISFLDDNSSINHHIDTKNTDYHKPASSYQGLTLAFKDTTKVMVKWHIKINSHFLYFDKSKLNISPSLLQKNIFYSKNSSALNQLINEFNAVQSCSQLSSVIRYLDYDLPENNKYCKTFSYLSYPYHPLGNLTKLEDIIATLDTPTKRWQYIDTVVSKLLASTQELHANGWIHGDIKPSNILLTKDENGDIQPIFIDFALALPAKVLSKSKTAQITGLTNGTPAYLAPECWQGKKKSVYSDYYALGLTIYEVLTGKHPLKHTNKSSQTWQEKHKNAQISQSQFSNDVYNKLVHNNPEYRKRTQTNDDCYAMQKLPVTLKKEVINNYKLISMLTKSKPDERSISHKVHG